MIKKLIREKMPELWKKYKILTSKEKIQGLKSETDKVFIFLAADYPNLGDIAITYAQKEFLKSCFPSREIIEIPADKTIHLIKQVKEVIKPTDIITIVGGGNMGNIYEYYEDMRRTVIKNFKDNYVISFPQTIDFSDDEYGKKSLLKTIKTIRKKANILVLAREEKSYKKMKDYFGEEKVKLFPDIVISLKKKINVDIKKEDKVALCFRNDKENDKSKIKLKEKIQKEIEGKNIVRFDTVLDKNCFDYEKRYEQLNQLIETIASCNVIYKDRLHAMIFAYLV